jgi:protein ImuB
VAGGTALLFAAKRVLMELAGFLAARQAGAQQLHWELVHGAAEPTRFTLGLLAPGHRAAGFLDLLRERLERLALPAPVRAIGLRVDRLHPLEVVSLPLFAEGGRGAARDESLLDRLRARLGEGAVRGLGQRPDHRPERAWSFCAPGMPSAALERPAGPRPLWLLEQPQPLEVRGGWPCWNGPLRLEPERERIESGWWDGRDVARDYFLARTGRGERLWVYREIGGRRLWFLHGFF